MGHSRLHPFNGHVSKHFGGSLSPSSPSSAADPPVLSYYNVRLYKSDMEALKSDWLTDACISFWEEYLEQAYLSDRPNTNIVLLRPDMSFLLMVQQDSEAIADALPKFKGTSHIFIPINDSSNPSSEGGSHWSLLLVSILDGIVYHYDSLNVHNKIQAEHVTQKLSRLLGLPLRGIHLEDNPQQENGMDCGVFVCLQMRYLLLRKLLSAPQHKQVDMNLEGYEVDSALGRKMMLQKIKEFRKEGERRRSRSPSPFSNHSRSMSPPRIGPP